MLLRVIEIPVRATPARKPVSSASRRAVVQGTGAAPHETTGRDGDHLVPGVLGGAKIPLEVKNKTLCNDGALKMPCLEKGVAFPICDPKGRHSERRCDFTGLRQLMRRTSLELIDDRRRIHGNRLIVIGEGTTKQVDWATFLLPC